MLPALLRLHQNRPPAMVCHGNHLECGCSPERVAARACCCWQNFSPCCIEKKNSPSANQIVAGRSVRQRRFGSVIVGAAPCGDWYGFDFADDAVCAIRQPATLSRIELSSEKYPFLEAAPPFVSTEPPVPPPRIFV